MATNTYVALKTATISGSSTNTVTFSSIPATYTDLVVVFNGALTSGTYDCLTSFNNDTSTNYSITGIRGNGSTVTTNTVANRNYIYPDYFTAVTTTFESNFIMHINNYSNTTTYKTVLTRANTLSRYVAASVNLWRSTAAINTITFLAGANNWAAGTTFSLYGIAAEGATAKATGGQITSDSTYWYHTFVSSGTFTPTTSISCDVLQIAGGGAGSVAGGGAGGLLYYGSQSLTATGYTVTVGAGGNGPADSGLSNGGNGSNSQFASLTASVGGGGGGGQWKSGSGVYAGSNGGSGGGGCSRDTTSTASGGTATSGQGFAGGTSSGNSQISGGGGGGAGVVGGNTASNVAGVGGNGINTYSSWSSATGTGVSGYYAGGGAGAYNFTASATGGLGGGGSLSSNTGVANTGSGGAASSNGGSGVVIVRYAR
jgi:hypothetical protein